jgi:hypothetical protein
MISVSQKLYTLLARYIDSVRLLYQNGQGEIWFSKGEEFAKGIIDRYQGQGKYKGADKALSIVY